MTSTPEEGAVRVPEQVADSASLHFPDYWWYRVRSRLLQRALGGFVPPGVVIDVGSADSPSVDWLPAIPLDRNEQALRRGICADALRLPFADGTVDGISAFDVVEHFPDDSALLGEFRRVLMPGGRLLISVPAYQWAWSDFDVRAGHHRRYTRDRLVRAVTAAGFVVDRATYAFAATLPLFAVARVLGGGGVGAMPKWQERLLIGLSRVDESLLGRFDLPFGSSVLLAAHAK